MVRQEAVANGGDQPEELFTHDVSLPHPLLLQGPLPGEVSFIPEGVTPIHHPSAPPRVMETPDPMLLTRLDAERKVLDNLDKNTGGMHMTLCDLLPDFPTRKDVANVFSTLLGKSSTQMVFGFSRFISWFIFYT